jgi:hypothetical protein
MRTTDPPTLWRFGVRLAGCIGAMLLASGALIRLLESLPQKSDRTQSEWERREEMTWRAFADHNPLSLDGWSASGPSEHEKWRTWTNGAISYADRDADGIADIKICVIRNSTDDRWWEDTDYDGRFDTEVTHGCFSHVEVPLAQSVVAPPVPQQPTFP